MLVGGTRSQDVVEGDRVRVSVRLGSRLEVRERAWMWIQRGGEEVRSEGTRVTPRVVLGAGESEVLVCGKVWQNCSGHMIGREQEMSTGTAKTQLKPGG